MEPPPNRGLLRSPAPPPTIAVDRPRTSSAQGQRPGSSDSGSSMSSNMTGLSVQKRPAYPSFGTHKNASTTSLASQRPAGPFLNEAARKTSALVPSGHRRQHSQGYFEPSMPSASLSSQTDQNASRIAALAAMQHLNSGSSHARRRSTTAPTEGYHDDSRRSSTGSASSEHLRAPTPDPELQYRNGLIGTTAAATAASAVFPRAIPAEEKESKKSGLRRFKPRHIGIIRDKEKEAKDKALPSPNKLPTSGLAKVVNASTTSLADTLSSNNSSFYNLANPSASTIVPVNPDRDKEKKHHGLRQKLKLKDKDEYSSLQLSSANSNSRPVDVHNPQSLYSFAATEPPHTSAFSKSVSGLDLRHGGRALRERKKEEKAQAEKAQALEAVYNRGDGDNMDWLSTHGASTGLTGAAGTPYSSDLKETLQSFGLNNMTPDDAWDLLKAKLLAVFEGENVRIAVEDLNRLVIIHIQRCVMKREPSIIIGDLEDLLRTGFMSLNHTLRTVADELLVSKLITMWISVFGTVLPFMQAVFLPLDQEFKGRGTVLTSPQMAAEFWGALPHANTGGQLSSSPSSGEDYQTDVAAGEELEVRRVLLISFRDTIILPRFDVLKTTFSRLSMESINASLTQMDAATRRRGNSGGSERTGTVSLDTTYSSYSSQGSTLLGTGSSGARSRATSNLSAGSNPAQDVAFQSFSSPPAARPGDNSSTLVAETVGRMLQCLSVLCSVQSGDVAQSKVEELNKQLKLNWLGRGRTGRNRKGFVGSRIRPLRSAASTIRGERDGSPTPTPTRQGTVSRQGDEASRAERA